MKEKTCRRCGERLKLSAFYAHPQMADGLLNVCKECVKSRVRSYRSKNIDKVRAYDRERGQSPERKEQNRIQYAARMKSEPERRKNSDRARLWREKNRVKRACHVIVGNAVRDGRLVKEPCQRCGITESIQAHHEDYGDPLAVTWLCKPCHGARHREINEERRSKMDGG